MIELMIRISVKSWIATGLSKVTTLEKVDYSTANDKDLLPDARVQFLSLSTPLFAPCCRVDVL